MKKLFSSLSFLSLLYLISCSKDDNEVSIGLKGTISIDSQTYEISNGAVATGTILGVSSDVFQLSDDVFNTEDGTFQGKLMITVLTASQGDTFESGTYTLDTEANDFVALVIVNIIDGSSENNIVGESGTVRITGSGSNYTFIFDIEFEDSTKMTGSAAGGFERYELTN